MEPNRDNPQNITPRAPMPGVPSRPVERRQFISDFAPRPSAPNPQQPQPNPQPTAFTPPSPIQPQAPTPQPFQINTPATPDPLPQPQQQVGGFGAPTTPQPQPTPPVPIENTEPAPEAKPTREPKEPKEAHPTAHAGIVGWIVFILLAALFLLPVLPGKTFKSLPGDSQSFSTGDQTLACASELGKVTSTTTYDSKAGFPVTYRYATTTTQQATCEGKTQSATTGHASQLSPLAALINVFAALILAIIIAKIWGKIFGDKR